MSTWSDRAPPASAATPPSAAPLSLSPSLSPAAPPPPSAPSPSPPPPSASAPPPPPAAAPSSSVAPFAPTRRPSFFVASSIAAACACERASTMRRSAVAAPFRRLSPSISAMSSMFSSYVSPNCVRLAAFPSCPSASFASSRSLCASASAAASSSSALSRAAKRSASVSLNVPPTSNGFQVAAKSLFTCCTCASDSAARRLSSPNRSAVALSATSCAASASRCSLCSVGVWLFFGFESARRRPSIFARWSASAFSAAASSTSSAAASAARRCRNAFWWRTKRSRCAISSKSRSWYMSSSIWPARGRCARRRSSSSRVLSACSASVSATARPYTFGACTSWYVRQTAASWVRSASAASADAMTGAAQSPSPKSTGSRCFARTSSAATAVQRARSRASSSAGIAEGAPSPSPPAGASVAADGSAPPATAASPLGRRRRRRRPARAQPGGARAGDHLIPGAATGGERVGVGVQHLLLVLEAEVLLLQPDLRLHLRGVDEPKRGDEILLLLEVGRLRRRLRRRRLRLLPRRLRRLRLLAALALALALRRRRRRRRCLRLRSRVPR